MAALAVAYFFYQSREEFGAKELTILVAIILLIAGSAHVATQHANAVLRYSPAAESQR